jgi:hypothetical protein
MPSAWEDERLRNLAAAGQVAAHPAMSLDPYSPIPKPVEDPDVVRVSKAQIEDWVHRLDLLAIYSERTASASHQLDIEDLANELRLLLPG